MDPALPTVLRNAGLVITGERITALGERADLRRQFGDLPVHRDPRPGILTPGLINAHTHLELSYHSRSPDSPEHFTDWVSALMAGHPPPEQLESIIRGALRHGAAESLRAGVTTLGDISRHAAFTRSELIAMQQSFLRATPRVVSFCEVVSLGKMRDRLSPLLDAALTPPPNISALPPDRLLLGVSPHAPYTVEGPTLRRIVSRAYLNHAPITMHLSELAEEAEFLEDLSGPLGRQWDLMQKLDILDNAIPTFRDGPIRWAQRWGLIVPSPRHPRLCPPHPPRDIPVLLAHVNYCDDAELAQLAVSRASIAYCPRTHAFFQHLSHRYRDMLDAGINVCLATDSLASNPDLSVLREAQFVMQRDNLDPHVAFDLITRRAAAALGLQEKLGTLTPGKYADLALFPCDTPIALPHDQLIRALLELAPVCLNTWISGKSTHPLQT